MSDILLLLENFIGLFMESAPWLLLGLLIAGIMHELVPVSLLEKHMGNNSLAAISKSAVIGAPLPLCSCGVIPAAVGLRRSGASKPATISFLVSTPETGVDSVSVSYALLGPVFAIVRPIVAVTSAIYAGILVRLFGQQDTVKAASSSCCASTQKAQQVSCCDSAPAKQDSCCESTSAATDTRSISQKVKDVLAYSSGNLLDDIMIWLLIGLGLAAVIQTWVPTDFLTRWGDGLVAMLIMAVIGIPMYICATASTPIAVGFLAAGLSPGAVLVFLMAGPATNISTMGMIQQEMGKRTLGLYLFAVMSASILAGYGLNALVATWDLSAYITGAASAHQHGGSVQLIYAFCAIVLAALMVRNLWRLAAAKWAPTANTPDCCH